MHLRRIDLKQFRSHRESSFEFDEKVTLITGKNGAGKTNILEAVYVLLQGTSFRVGDKELTQFDESWWRVDGDIDGVKRQVRFERDKRPAKQLVVHDNAKRFMYRDKLPVVLFEPNDLLLVHGSPSRRRDTLDTMISSLSEDYKKTLTRYERALKQRNTLLKRGTLVTEETLFVWDVALSDYGSAIVEKRAEFIKQLNEMLPEFYSNISDTQTNLFVSYNSKLPLPVTPSVIMSALNSHRTIDVIRASTSIGPHRDDMTFCLNKNDAKTTASRGEVRTILLALKLAYAKLLEQQYAIKPLFLLDDVFSELDEDRQKKILENTHNNQTIITDTKKVFSGFTIRL